MTVTVKLQAEKFRLASVAVQLTVVTPTGNTVPEDGVQTGVTDPAHRSCAVTKKLTAVPAGLAVETLILAEQAMAGRVVSTAVTF